MLVGRLCMIARWTPDAGGAPTWNRMPGGDVGRLEGIGLEVVRRARRSRGLRVAVDTVPDALPLPHADGPQAATGMELPVEMVSARAGPLPSSTGEKSIPSSVASDSAPAIESSVGMRSQFATGVGSLESASIRPGQATMNGTRMPPS